MPLGFRGLGIQHGRDPQGIPAVISQERRGEELTGSSITPTARGDKPSR
jgi:hypothetical protein